MKISLEVWQDVSHSKDLVGWSRPFTSTVFSHGPLPSFSLHQSVPIQHAFAFYFCVSVLDHYVQIALLVELARNVRHMEFRSFHNWHALASEVRSTQHCAIKSDSAFFTTSLTLVLSLDFIVLPSRKEQNCNPKVCSCFTCEKSG